MQQLKLTSEQKADMSYRKTVREALNILFDAAKSLKRGALDVKRALSGFSNAEMESYPWKLLAFLNESKLPVQPTSYIHDFHKSNFKTEIKILIKNFLEGI